VVENGGLLKVVPEADAKLQTSTVSVGEVATRGDQIITQIFTLRYENPNNLVAVLRPLISANNTINANPGNNSLVITDYADNLQRIAKIIAALDQPAATDIEIVPLQHVVASDIAQLVQRLADGAAGISVPGLPAAGAPRCWPTPRSNSLLVRAAEPGAAGHHASAHHRQAGPPRASQRRPRGRHVGGAPEERRRHQAWPPCCARPSAAGGTGGAGGAPRACRCRDNTLPSRHRGPRARRAARQHPAPHGDRAGRRAAQVSTGGFIQADPATNSLIITAAEPLYRQVRG
jgi:general secretion pathway protein D